MQDKTQKFQSEDGKKQIMTQKGAQWTTASESNPGYYNMVLPSEKVTEAQLRDESFEGELLKVLPDSTDEYLYCVTHMPRSLFTRSGLSVMAEPHYRTPDGLVEAVNSTSFIKKPFMVEAPLMPGHPMSKDLVTMLCEMAKQEGFDMVYGIEENRFREGDQVSNESVLRLLGIKG